MSKLSKFIEDLLLPLTATISLLVSLGDLFDLFHLVAPGRIPMLTLLLIAIALGSLSFMQRRSIESYRNVQRLLSKAELEHINGMLEQINPDLIKVLGVDYFLNIADFLSVAVREGTVPIHDMKRFRHYCVRMFQNYPKATFFITTPATTSYLWRDETIKNAIATFLKAGGRLRVVLLAKNALEQKAAQTQTFVAQMKANGIQVHIVDSTLVPADLRKIFIVEAKGKIAWETSVNEDGDVDSSMILTNERSVTNYKRVFGHLWEDEIRKKHTGI